MKRPRPALKAAAGPTSDATSDARAALLAWLRPVLQPGKRAWGGWGVARPSAFCDGSSPRFLEAVGKVMGDRGGAGSWLWKKLPPEAKTQGAVRPLGGAARQLAARLAVVKEAETASKELREAETRKRRLRAAETARMEATKASFMEEQRSLGGGGKRGVKPTSAPAAAPADARSAAIAAYRALKQAKGGGQPAKAASFKRGGGADLRAFTAPFER